MQKERKSGIYCIENTITNKKYIGQSVNIYDRWSKHKSELKHGYHDNDYLQKAWNKYGEDCFRFYILEECNIEELDEKENFYIEFYNTLNKNLGYNLKSGGQCGGAVVSDEIREKMSYAVKQSYTPELKERRKQDALEQWNDPKIKAKIVGENNGMYGKTHSKETRRKISESKKDKPSPKRDTTPILCVELNEIFKCAADVSKLFNIQSGTILNVCRGKRHTAGGYHWQFVIGNNI